MVVFEGVMIDISDRKPAEISYAWVAVPAKADADEARHAENRRLISPVNMGPFN